MTGILLALAVALGTWKCVAGFEKHAWGFLFQSHFSRRGGSHLVALASFLTAVTRARVTKGAADESRE